MLATQTMLQNRYYIVRLIGHGGMGAVYEAVDQALGATVALKQMMLHDTRARRAFEREARLLAHLRHPSLPKVSNYFVESSDQFLVMEFIPGTDLGELLAQYGPLPVADVLRWADHLLDALDYMHSHTEPVIHRDIKPSNLKLTPRGEIILLDFGLAKGAIGPGETVGGSLHAFTPHYAPLEQIRGTGTTPRSDLFALAATLYHLLTGSVPIDALARAETMVAGQPDPLRPPHRIRPEVPAEVSKVLLRALSLNQNQRPDSATRLRADLRNAAQALGRSQNTHQPGNSWLRSMVAKLLGKSPPTTSSRKTDIVMPQPIVTPSRFVVTNPPMMLPTIPISPASIAQVTCLARWGRGACTGVKWTADGRTLVVGFSSGIYVHSFPYLDQTRFIEREAQVRSMDVDPSGQMIATGDADGKFRLWRVGDGKLLHTLELEEQDGSYCRCSDVAFSPDGRVLVTVGKEVNLWRLSDCRLMHNLIRAEQYTSFSYNDMAFSPDGQILAISWGYIGSGTPFRSSTWGVYLFRVCDGKKLFFRNHSCCGPIAFAPDSQMYAVAAAYMQINYPGIQLYRIQFGLRLQVNLLRIPSSPDFGYVYDLSFSSDGKTLASAEQGEGMERVICVRSIADGRLLHILKGIYSRPFTCINVAFSPDGQTLVSQSHNELQLWRTSDYALLYVCNYTNDSGVLSPDGRMLASVSDKAIRMLNVQDGKLLYTLEAGDIVFSPDSQCFREAGDIVFSPDSQCFAAYYGGGVGVYRVSDGEFLCALKVIKELTTRVFTRLQFTQDSQTLAVAYFDDSPRLASGNITFWQVPTGRLLARYPFPEDARSDIVSDIVFAPNLQTLAATKADYDIGLWHMQNGSLLHTLYGHTSYVGDMAFSPDGQLLASASSDTTVRLWHVQDGRLLSTLQGHRSAVSSLAFTPDGQVLASGASDGSILLWQVADGQLLGTLQGTNARVRSLSFAANGRLMASGLDDGTMRLWGVQP